MRFVRLVILAVGLVALSSCGGGGSGSSPGGSGKANVGGGYTLEVSGGTYNGGTGTNGLAILATLRDSNGFGPGLTGGWQVTITGPGLAQPLTAAYDDGSSSSFKSWWWQGITPAGGAYTATATNGTATLTYGFSISSGSTLPQPPLTRSGTTVAWNAVTGAGSYYYEVIDGYGATAQSGYLNGGSSTYSFPLASLPDGSYSISVYAQTESRVDLMNDSSPMPLLPAQDNISVSSVDAVVSSGSVGSYSLSAAGGTLNMGQSSGVDMYGLTVWSSILTTGGTPPASDWTVSVTGPGITTPITFTYPKTDSHYVYWDYGTVPAAGLYTVTATSPDATGTLTAQFTIPAPTAQLPVATGIGVTAGANGYTVSWNPVTGAGSYHVNLWADVGGIYTEVAGSWVGGSTLSAQIPNAELTKGTLYDVYVTSCTLDMTTATSLPPPAPSQVDMSDNTFAPVSFTAR